MKVNWFRLILLGTAGGVIAWVLGRLGVPFFISSVAFPMVAGFICQSYWPVFEL